jgi:dihydropyrimidinase
MTGGAFNECPASSFPAAIASIIPNSGGIMLKRILISGGTVVRADDTRQADVLIEDETIKEVRAGIQAEAVDEIDANGKLILPGGIDPHTHFDLPMFDTVSSDDHYTGLKAAAFGGTTTVLDFIPQEGETLQDSVADWKAKAVDRAAIDFGFHMNITKLTPEILSELSSLPDLGITTLKVFTAYNRRLRLQDGEIFQVMREGAAHGLLTMLHAENGDVIDILVAEALEAGNSAPEWHAHTRPAWGAAESVLRGIALAQQANSPVYIVHVNTAGGLEHIRLAREAGARVMGETCPQYLFFTEDDLRRPDGAKWICSPPMRTESDNQALWGGLQLGSLQTVGTDHCPFFFDGATSINYEGKQVSIPGKELGASDFTKIPNGLPGVGDRLPVLWTKAVVAGKISAEQFVALTSTNPAKIFGLYPRKGDLLAGSDADLVIWDPKKRVNYGVEHAHHRTDYNLYEGWELTGYPEKVFLRGQLIVDNGTWLGKPGMGQFLMREPGAQVI